MVFERFQEINDRKIDDLISKELKTKRKSSGSFSEILFGSFSAQSINIKMGIVLENSWKETISSTDGVTLMNLDKILGHQIDLLFVKKSNDTVYYFESKNNLNLDTEKTIATVNKVEDIKHELEKSYKNVVAKILSNRYDCGHNAENFKKPMTKDMIFGYSDLFNILDEDVTKEQWNSYFKSVGNKITEGVKY